MEEELCDCDEKIELMKVCIDEFEVMGSEFIGVCELVVSVM